MTTSREALQALVLALALSLLTWSEKASFFSTGPTSSYEDPLATRDEAQAHSSMHACLLALVFGSSRQVASCPDRRAVTSIT